LSVLTALRSAPSLRLRFSEKQCARAGGAGQGRTDARHATPLRLPMPARRNRHTCTGTTGVPHTTDIPARHPYLLRAGAGAGPYHARFAVPATGAGRRAGTLTRPYRHAGRTAHDGRERRHSRTPYAPEPGQGRTTPGLPYQPDEGAARRNPAQAVPDRRLYRPRPACSCDTRTPYAPGPGAPGEPGRTAGNAEQSAPAVRSVATARRASDTDSGSAASYTTPHTTRRPRLAWMNHRRRSAQGTIVTRQSRTLLTYHLPMPKSAPRAPGATQPAPT